MAISGLLISLCVSISTVIFGLQSYHRLSAETLIAELSFEKLGQHQYQATLLRGDFCHSNSYLVLGDQWRLDAKFLKWRSWATVLGLNSRYQLDRLEGRYEEVEQQNNLPKLSHDLKKDGQASKFLPIDPLLVLFADAEYGSSTFEIIDSDKVYQVFKTPTGLITRSRAKLLDRDSSGSLVIEINHACA